MNTSNLNLQMLASAIAALALTMLMSWTFVDATSVARVHRDGSHGFVASVSGLVR